MNLRLFIAVEPTAAVRREAERATAHLRQQLPALRARYLDAGSAHLTLLFLGRIAEAEVAEVARLTASASGATSPFVSRTARLGAFPSIRRPGVLWLGLDDTSTRLAALQRDLVGALTPYLAARRAERFAPHLTLARIDTPAGAPRAAVSEALAGFQPTAVPWPVAEVVLFHSELRREGARYHALARAPLAAAAP